MANSNAKPDAGDNGIQVEQLEVLFREIQQQRSMNRYVAIFSVLTILTILLVFCFRLYGIYSDYNQYVQQMNTNNLMEVLANPENPVKISEHDSPEVDMVVRNLIKMSHERIAPSIKRSQQRFVNDILPGFSEAVTDRMAHRSDEFEAQGVQMLENIKTHAETKLKEELLIAMGEGMMEISEEIEQVFPELNDKKLAAELKGSGAYLFDELHNLGMMKVAKFDPVLRGLKSQVDMMAKGQKVTPEMREKIMDEFIEGLFDRVKYEFVPAMGELHAGPYPPKAPEAVEPKKGGE